MKKLALLFLFISFNISSQKIKDSLPTIDTEILFSDMDLATINSLLMNDKFRSPLYDTAQYFIRDLAKVDISNIELSSELLKERLAKINQKTPFHIAYNPALEKVIKSYLKYRKRYYPALMAKTKYYFPMFEEYLTEFDIPMEMKYLAIVESTLDPRARSRMGATGLWQFMYATGLQYKLKVSSYVDERQDPVKATIAACKYLSDLYQIFGDWDLALAAYNSGPGNVLKAIKRSGGYRNYWNIRPYLPRETAGYVPAFYATMYLFEYAEEHDLVSDVPDIYHFETDTIRVRNTISFDQIIEKTSMSLDLVSFLNPAYKLDVIPKIDGKNYVIKIPKQNVIEFLNAENDIYLQAKKDASKREKPLPQYFEMDKRIRYKVISGDFLGKIANKFGVRISDLKRWNSLRNNRLKVGQRLSVYPKKSQISSTAVTKKAVAKEKAAPNKKSKFIVYIVEKGDSLWTISQKYLKVSVDEIKKWNNIWDVKSIKPGTKLKIFKS